MPAAASVADLMKMKSRKTKKQALFVSTRSVVSLSGLDQFWISSWSGSVLLVLFFTSCLNVF